MHKNNEETISLHGPRGHTLRSQPSQRHTKCKETKPCRNPSTSQAYLRQFSNIENPSEPIPKKEQGLPVASPIDACPSLKILLVWFALRKPGERKRGFFFGFRNRIDRGKHTRAGTQDNGPPLDTDAVRSLCCKLDRCSHNNTERDECRCRRKHFS